MRQSVIDMQLDTICEPYTTRPHLSSGRFRKQSWGPYFNSSDGTCWLRRGEASCPFYTSVFPHNAIQLPLCLSTTPWRRKDGMEAKLRAFLTPTLEGDE